MHLIGIAMGLTSRWQAGGVPLELAERCNRYFLEGFRYRVWKRGFMDVHTQAKMHMHACACAARLS